MKTLKSPHRRLQNELEHEGEHNRQDDLRRNIASGKHCQQKETTQKHRLDIRCYGQIIVIVSRNNNGRSDRGVVSCLAAYQQLQLPYPRHLEILCPRVLDKPLREWRLAMPNHNRWGMSKFAGRLWPNSSCHFARATIIPRTGKRLPDHHDQHADCEIAPPGRVRPLVGLGHPLVANPATLSHRNYLRPFIVTVMPRRPGDGRRRLDYGEAQSFQNLPLRRSLRLIGTSFMPASPGRRTFRYRIFRPTHTPLRRARTA